MLIAPSPLGAVVRTPCQHGPSSITSTVSAGRPAPSRRRSCTRRRTVSKVSCSSSLAEADEAAVGTVTLPRSVSPLMRRDPNEKMTLKARVTVRMGSIMSHTGSAVLDFLGDALFNQHWLYLELFSSEVDPATGRERDPIRSVATDVGRSGDGEFPQVYEASFMVPAWFGPVGAVRVENNHRREVLLGNIEVFRDDRGFERSPVTFHCNSWIHTKRDGSTDVRTFFPLKSCLPSKTPKGVERLRRSELEAIRGNGRGERKEFERIYDYDVYNDLGNADDAETRRPVLGGEKHPYPRRCRTGRPRSEKDPSSERRPNKESIYVPRDEAFTEGKDLAFNTKLILSGLHAFCTSNKAKEHKSMSFPSLAAIDALFEDGFRNQPGEEGSVLTSLISLLEKELPHPLKFETPEIRGRDKFAWFRDEEFARETLAGMNPLSIQLVKELPIVSKLDEETYGSSDSLITKQLIEEQIKGVMAAEEAVDNKKLFMLDYHDMFLPYVNKVRELDDTTLYGSRTLFFLTKDGTLRPIAIELTRPKSPTMEQWRQVFTPGSSDASITGSWLWQLAKAHVLAHDTGYHQLVSHWLRTHCCVEPYIIAANRRLSQMHPIYRLLHPHFRFTMEINALARDKLISADGVIESSFSPGKYCMELSSAVYDKFWRFDMEALPADLVRRGMAVENDGELELTIEDYPYANDGLLVWKAIKEWASDYVKHYYPSVEDITRDEELNGWWEEVRTKGHADKQGELWWPKLDSHESLVQVLTTIMWVTSGHHAAVNFGQYPFAGYFPNRPTIARRNMPSEESDEDMGRFVAKPEKVLLDTFPSQFQSTLVLPVLDVLSSHSAGEEYLGTYAEPAWMADREIKAAFEKFKGKMTGIVGQIDEWNAKPERKNRHGAGMVPYVLLKPFSSGDHRRTVMGMGIPNSISI